jgi:hypothetical protein
MTTTHDDERGRARAPPPRRLITARIAAPKRRTAREIFAFQGLKGRIL